MFSTQDLVEKSPEEMKREVDELMAESARLRAEYDSTLERSDDLRRESVEARSGNVELAEVLWTESEKLRDDSRELMRLSIEKRIRAADIKHRLDIKAEIEAIDAYDEAWRKAVRAGRS